MKIYIINPLKFCYFVVIVTLASTKLNAQSYEIEGRTIVDVGDTEIYELVDGDNDQPIAAIYDTSGWFFSWESLGGNNFPDFGDVEYIEGYDIPSIKILLNRSDRIEVLILDNLGDLYFTDLDINLPSPPTPPAPTISDVTCANITLTRTGTPPVGVTWYWQGTNPWGKSITLGSGVTYTVTDNGTYYLRARNNNSLIWSSSSGSVGVTLSSKLWYSDVDGDSFGDPNVSINSGCKPQGYVINNTDNCPNEFGYINGCDIYTEPNLSDENYIYTRTFQTRTTTGSVTSNKDVIDNVTYFDGLGRPIQSIGIKQSATQKDIISHIEYDDLGRKTKEYLPYSASDIGIDASYRTNALVSTNNFYNTEKYEYTTNPYSKQVFDGSPLNLVVESAAPGNLWAEGMHTIKNEIKLIENTDEVINFHVTNGLSANYLVDKGPFTIGELTQGATFKAPTLYKLIIKNENWYNNQQYENDNTTHTFKDYRGRIILNRTFESNVPHDTYYVYDNYGNLSYVITPNVDVSNGVDSSELSKLCYQYRYDGKNRLIEKQLPGKAREYIVYDQLNRPVLTQDALQKASNKWLFTKYDAYERVVYTGVYTSTSDRAALQNQIEAFVDRPFYETKRSATSIDGATVYYSNNVFPNTAIELLTISYYDDYNFDAASNPGVVYDENITTRTKGLATGSKVKVLGQLNKWITTTTYYDNKAKPVYLHSNNDYLKTIDIVENNFDFVGKAIEIKNTHDKTGQSTITTKDYFNYDHVGRLKQQSQVINNNIDNKETIVENMYDELGQLITKGVGGLSSSINRLQFVNYKYNIRGWLKQINDPTSLGNDLFGFKIGYTDGTTPLFNGNISNTHWNTQSAITGGNNISYNYNFSYDALNRIKTGIDNTGNYNLTAVDYDKNGNILHLNRKGNRDDNATVFGEMDNLSYYYNGNQLHSVTDTSVATGFNDINSSDTSLSTLTDNDYKYDINGNLIEDKNKGITGITYNYLNLPTQVIFATDKYIDYIYDATGVKLQKQVNDIGNIIKTNYAGNYIYEDNGFTEELKFFNQPEGYVEPTGDVNNPFQYVYQYKDHLGNIRLSYSDANNDGQITASTEIIEESNYYPFGLKHKGYNANINGTHHKYMFGGKEFDESFNGTLNTYDFGARNYDPALGRWMNIDPLAEQMRRHSPYNYAFDNPIYFIDPDGMRPGRFDEAAWVEDPIYDNRAYEFLNGKTYAGGWFDGNGFGFSGGVVDDGRGDIHLAHYADGSISVISQKEFNKYIGDGIEDISQQDPPPFDKINFGKKGIDLLNQYIQWYHYLNKTRLTRKDMWPSDVIDFSKQRKKTGFDSFGSLNGSYLTKEEYTTTDGYLIMSFDSSLARSKNENHVIQGATLVLRGTNINPNEKIYHYSLIMQDGGSALNMIIYGEGLAKRVDNAVYNGGFFENKTLKY